MYERSAIVLERYFEKIFGFTKENNLKTNYEIYSDIIEEIGEYKRIIEEEEKVIGKFDEVATEIEDIQSKQSKLHESNLELENQRNRLFNDLGENPNTLDYKLQKIEEKIEENNEGLKELRERYVKAIVIFTERQKERNKYSRTRRTAEANHKNNIENANKMFEAINKKDVQVMQKFINFDKERIKQEIMNIMIRNGKSERVPFNGKAIERAVNTRLNIAKEEAELYINIYDKTKKILSELDNENIKLSRAEKLVRDTSVKLAFLNAEKEYIVGFLDNERMTAINGQKTHEKLMEEACENFDDDMKQINNLYELVLKETIGKSTKKAYKELYNKNYLREIKVKEKNFEEEVTSIKINIGTVINSNYWRIEGIKNIYKVFQEEIGEKFNKDLSEFRVEDIEDIILPGNEMAMASEKDFEEDSKEFHNNKNSEIYTDEDYKDEDYEDEDYDEDNEEEYGEDEFYNDEESHHEEIEDFYEEDEEYEERLEDEKEIYEEDNEGEFVEDNIDEIIKNIRKKEKGKNEKNRSGGLFGKLFKK